MIQKNNGENVFIPQYRSDRWIQESIIKIVFAIPALFIWFCANRSPSLLATYFNSWKDIEILEQAILFKVNDKLPITNKANAEWAIKNHKEKIRENIKKEKEKEFEKHMNKTKKVLYIKIK